MFRSLVVVVVCSTFVACTSPERNFANPLQTTDAGAETQDEQNWAATGADASDEKTGGSQGEATSHGDSGSTSGNKDSELEATGSEDSDPTESETITSDPAAETTDRDDETSGDGENTADACTCEGDAVCVDQAGEAACVDFCAEERGGCDALTECSNTPDGPTCGVCPDGYVGDGHAGCAPTLLSLSFSHGALSPELEPGREAYEVVVPVYIQNVTLTPTAPAGTTVGIRGAAVASGSSWTSPNLDLGENELRILVGSAGQRSTEYTLTVIRGGDPTDYIKASNTRASAGFSEVALSADGSTLAVGASLETSSATGIGGDEGDGNGAFGAVYVFVRNDSTWTQQAYIKASNTGEGDFFGHTVALSKDGNTLAVGAPGEKSSARGINGDQDNDHVVGAGAVYVFTRSGSSWAQQAYVKATNTHHYNSFGWSVALSRDGNTLAVAAYGEFSAATGINGDQNDTSLVGAGAVYIFVRNGTSWAEQAYVKASNTNGYDAFGTSVALSDNGNTLAVGAPSEGSDASGIDGRQTNDDAEGSGAVYVFVRNGAAWSQQAYIKASNTGAGDAFGYAVALSGDGNDLAVGAPDEDSLSSGIDGPQDNDDAENSGAVYVFVRSGTSWTQQAYVKASETGYGDTFGRTVALSDDGNTLAVGATGDDSNATGVNGNQNNDGAANSGAVYVFVRRGASWSQHAYVKASNTEAGDAFGHAVALSGDGSALAVGAPREESNATGVGGNQSNNSMSGSGAVYVYR